MLTRNLEGLVSNFNFHIPKDCFSTTFSFLVQFVQSKFTVAWERPEANPLTLQHIELSPEVDVDETDDVESNDDNIIIID
jgi:hypothetical protein